MKININHIILGLLVIIFIQGFLKAPEGISEEEEIYRIKIHDLNQEKVALKIEIVKRDSQINTFKNERTKIDSIVDGYSVNQLDSFYTDFFK